MPEDSGIISTAPAAEPVVAAPATPAEGGTSPAEKPAGEAPATPAGEKPAEGKGAEAPEKDKTDEQPEKQGKSRFERRLDKAYRKAAEQQARADFLEGQLKQFTAKPADAGEPKLEQFNDIEEYANAKAKFAADKAVREKDTAAQKATQQQYVQRVAAEWEGKVDKAQERYADWDEKVGELKPDTPLAFAIMEAENGPDIAHHLATNTAEARRIAALPPLSAAREIGKLEAKLLAEPAKPKTPSNAPVPIKPVGGSASPSTKKLSEMTQSEFEKHRRAYAASR